MKNVQYNTEKNGAFIFVVSWELEVYLSIYNMTTATISGKTIT